ncbi:NUDIX domain-containing protein [Bdellovibrio sp. HCB337]|uniref:NUDIX domain-containing protein n=1 Tax=Bdellovibrio sp. HCB337 TaxID=3394358 RepID=UPI0039A47B1F
MSYRKGIAVIILSADSTQVLLGERTNERGQWQIPQGGAEKGESILETLERELLEEVGIAVPKVLRQTERYIRYEWPEGLFKKSKHVGQEHIYFVLDGSKVDVQKLRPTEEFIHFKWAPIEEILKLSVSWKREALSEALRELELID